MKKTAPVALTLPRSTPAILGVVLTLTVTDCYSPKAEEGLQYVDYQATEYDNIRYPGFEPAPELETPPPVDERALWKLLSKQKTDELKLLIERYQRQYPDWTPPSDLIAALIRVEIASAKENEDWVHILRLKRDYPSAFSCIEIANQWTLGDAYAAEGLSAELTELYLNMVRTCADAEHRLVTLQRASQQLPRTTTESLLELEKTRPHSVDESTALNDFHYGFYTGWLAEAWTNKNDTAMQSALAPIEEEIVTRKDANTASLLGWWEMRRLNPGKAQVWFQHAVSWAPTNDNAYGLALSLRDSNQPQAAQSLARNWQEKDERFRSLIPSRQAAAAPAPKLRPDQVALNRANRAYRNQDYSQAAKIARTALDRDLPRRSEKDLHALGLVEAWSHYHQFDIRTAEDQFASLYQAQPEIESARGLVFSAIENKHHQRVIEIGREDCGPLNFFLSSRAPADQPDTADLYYAFYKSWIGEYLKDKHYFDVLFNFKRITEQVVTRQDASMAAAAGWGYFDKKDYGNALYWFERAMAWGPSAASAHGLAQSMRRLGNHDGALALAQEWQAQSDAMRALSAELLLARSEKHYAAGDYAGSLADAEASAALNPSIAANKRIAWSRYQLGEHAAAAAQFESLYREHPDKETGDGLAASLQALSKESDLERLASELGGPVRDNVADIHAVRQFYRDQFILADQTRVNTLPELKNIGTPAIAIMPYARHRSGEDGLGQLDMTGVEIEGKAAFGLHTFTASLDLMNLRSGTPANTALLGNNVSGLPNVFSQTPISKESGLLEPMLTYRYAGDISPFVQIGTTPLGADSEVGAALVGKVGVDIKSDTRHIHVEAFAENKQESILSTVGSVDPVTGDKWGRVVEKGVRVNISQQLNEKWRGNAGGEISTLDGHNVADNDHVAVWASAGYELERKGFKYLSVGPSYRFDHYSDNRNFFTFGHGGYFSPDAFHRLSAEVNFQTEEAKQFVVRGRAALGVQYSDEADARALPLSNTGPLYTGGSDTGIAFDGQLEGVYRLNHWLQLGAFVNVTQSPDFDDVGGGVFLRVNAFDRPAVFSSDLKSRPWND